MMIVTIDYDDHHHHQMRRKISGCATGNYTICLGPAEKCLCTSSIGDHFPISSTIMTTILHSAYMRNWQEELGKKCSGKEIEGANNYPQFTHFEQQQQPGGK